MRKFDYPAEKEDILLRNARMGLGEKIDDLPDYFEKNTYDEKFSFYEACIVQEILVLREIGFDGYMLLLQDVVIVSREISDYVQCFGSVSNSLTAYVLDIVDDYKFDGLQNFINFTPFTSNVRVNILISTFANNGCLGYIKHKYPKLIKKIKRKSVMFNDGFKIKFIDLDVHAQVEQEDLSDLTLQLLKNNKIIK